MAKPAEDIKERAIEMAARGLDTLRQKVDAILKVVRDEHNHLMKGQTLRAKITWGHQRFEIWLKCGETLSTDPQAFWVTGVDWPECCRWYFIPPSLDQVGEVIEKPMYFYMKADTLAMTFAALEVIERAIWEQVYLVAIKTAIGQDSEDKDDA